MKNKIKETVLCRMGRVNDSAFRQSYHLMADIGWISDPNGFCVHNGVVHIFHQYTPAEDLKLHKSWGHWTTTDWHHFKDEGTLMCPDSWMDKDGCYSGSGYSRNGLLHLFYTGNVLEEGDHDYIYEGRGHYVCHRASADGIHFSQKECLLKNEAYPANMSCHVRDPKVADTQGITTMVLGARTKDDRGCALLYKADESDPTRMAFMQVIDSDKRFGYMWECPDLFELDGKLYLLCCPQGVKTQGHNYENVYQNGVFAIEGDLEGGNLEARDFQELDRGFDFYAPQTMLDEKGRRILLGWVGMPDAEYTYPEKEDLWIHCLTLPRQLTRKNDQVYMRPIDEVYEQIRGRKKLELKENQPETLESPVFYLKLDIASKPFAISVRNDADIVWDGSVLTLRMNESGAGRSERHIDLSDMRTLEIFSDVSSLELFVDEGRYAMTTRVYDAGKPLMLMAERGMSAEIGSVEPYSYDYSAVLGDKAED